MQLIATFLLVLAAALSNAQSLSGSTAPPKGCEVCNTFIGQMQTCKTTAAPASEAQVSLNALLLRLLRLLLDTNLHCSGSILLLN